MKKIKQKHLNKLSKIVNDLNNTMDLIRKDFPEANLYFNGECALSMNLHLKEYDVEPQGEWYWSNVWGKDIYHADCGGY